MQVFHLSVSSGKASLQKIKFSDPMKSALLLFLTVSGWLAFVYVATSRLLMRTNTVSTICKYGTLRNPHLITDGWKTVHMYIGNSSVTHHDKNKAELYAPARKNQTSFWSSQAGQDITVAAIFNNKTGGYFVDLAANNAIYLSNTYALEVGFDWNGLCIEGNTRYLWDLAHRKCTVVSAVVWNESDSLVPFTTGGDELGGVISETADNKNKHARHVLMPGVSLQKILVAMRSPSVIDYLSLDVEGVEEIILQGFDFDKYTFLVITVERPKPMLKLMLTRNGYVFLKVHGNFGDEMWIHKSLPNINTVMDHHQNL